MNTLSYLSSLLLPTTRNVTPLHQQDPSSPTVPHDDEPTIHADDPTASTTTIEALGAEDEAKVEELLAQALNASGDTLYLSARTRRRSSGAAAGKGDSHVGGAAELGTTVDDAGAPSAISDTATTTTTTTDEEDEPVVRISTAPPPHLVDIANAQGLTRKISLRSKSSATSPVILDEEYNENSSLDSTTTTPADNDVDSETKEAERRHAQKDLEYRQRVLSPPRRSMIGLLRLPIPGLTSLWSLVRNVWAFFSGTRVRPVPAVIEKSGIEQQPTIDLSDGGNELAESLEKAAAAADPKTTSTHPSTKSLSFFRRKPSSDLTHTTPSIPKPPTQPPRLTPKVLVLDLDETLIHSTSRPYASSRKSAGLKVRLVEVVLEGRSTVYTVYKRPWVDYFLRKVSTWYTVIIFTASLPEYADPVIDWLDGGDGGGGMVGGRLFRSDCLHSNGTYVKDLSVVDADLSKVCLVDNSPVSYAINQANGIPIEGWINDPNDECLLDLLPMLDSLRFTNDVRRVLGLRGFGK
ncbi:BZ3500_MvSof-1268-A1-R1_Chr2-2g04751 [Microbotryum saponariae]|uniref:BZ3500_MvSof-1268-A1-R1_Chr2-2g04751 protein n=1 Tax=Microbotryum saponariae TaxID=289078 RepID=A0A2X0L0M2_9BASI|nr:BZ3500_MvSof-1268-A1-R1_Chr2-2g04751 [Microbotryum saponariae]SDA00071.1 BZ3501_MvSof-1269-A2-R1_Chr2-2g04425 [Microbotryum saponariae]